MKVVTMTVRELLMDKYGKKDGAMMATAMLFGITFYLGIFTAVVAFGFYAGIVSAIEYVKFVF